VDKSAARTRRGGGGGTRSHRQKKPQLITNPKKKGVLLHVEQQQESRINSPGMVVPSGNPGVAVTMEKYSESKIKRKVEKRCVLCARERSVREKPQRAWGGRKGKQNVIWGQEGGRRSKTGNF